MEINEEDIIGSYILDDGSRYIFLKDKTVYKQKKDGSLIKIELNNSNIKKIRNDIGEPPTDIVR